jgi:acyl-coenzyme A thioesterase PaaI-like protein
MNARSFDPESPAVRKLRSQVTSRVQLAAFMGAKLPLGLLAGLRIHSLDAEQCVCSVRYRWMTTNPFRSTYFAALAMAAEMSTGALGLSLVRAAPEPVSILIVGMHGTFTKKATDRTTFTCADGRKVQDAVLQALTSGQGVTVQTETIGRNQAGDEVARFTFTWSFRKKGARA